MSDNKRDIHQQVIKRATTSPEVSAFEQIKREDENGECWSARELAALLGYGSGWRNFERVIEEAKEVCATNGGDVERLFVAVVKKSRGRDATDYRLTRHACYIIAQSADGRKPQVAFATQYFALTAERHDSLMQAQEACQRVGRAALYGAGQHKEAKAPDDERDQRVSDHTGGLAAAADDFRAALARQLLVDRNVADAQTANQTYLEAGASVRALLVE